MRQINSRSPRSIDELHGLVVGGDQGAMDEMSTRLLRALPHVLQRRCYGLPYDFIVQAVADALLEYAANPSRFYPAGGTQLYSLIYAASLRNAFNLIQSEKRRRRREAIFTAWNQHTRQSPTESHKGSAFRLLRTAMRIAVDPVEKAYLHAWLRGDKDLARIIERLGCNNLSAVEQRAAVKRLRERIIKRLRRRFHSEREVTSHPVAVTWSSMDQRPRSLV